MADPREYVLTSNLDEILAASREIARARIVGVPWPLLLERWTFRILSGFLALISAGALESSFAHLGYPARNVIFCATFIPLWFCMVYTHDNLAVALWSKRRFQKVSRSHQPYTYKVVADDERLSVFYNGKSVSLNWSEVYEITAVKGGLMISADLVGVLIAPNDFESKAAFLDFVAYAKQRVADAKK